MGSFAETKGITVVETDVSTMLHSRNVFPGKAGTEPGQQQKS